MARTIRAPRAEVTTLADADLITGYRCAEALATDSLADYGPDVADLTDTSSPGVAADLVTLAATGARDLDGAADHFHRNDTGYFADFQGECSGWAFVNLDTVASLQTFIAYGGTRDGTADDNLGFSIGCTAGGLLFVEWERATGTDVQTTGPALTASASYFVGVAKRVDVDNAGRYVVEMYAGNLATKVWTKTRTENLLNTDGTAGTGALRMTAGVDSDITNRRMNGRLGDCGFARVALHEWWFRAQFRNAVKTYDQEDMLALSVGGRARARVLVEDSDRAWVDLSALGHGIDHLSAVRLSTQVDSPSSTAEVSLYRQHHALNLAIEDRTSAYNLNDAAAYAPLLQARRKMRVEACFIPTHHERAINEWEYEGVFEGWLDEPDYGKDVMSIRALDHTQILKDAQIVGGGTSYGVFAGTTVLDTTLASIVTDNEPAAGYLGGVVPTLYFPVATGLTHNDFWQNGMAVYDALAVLLEVYGFDLRSTYDDVREEYRLTVSEPDRVSGASDWIWQEDIDYNAITKARQTSSDIRNRCRVYYGNTAGTNDSEGERARTYEEYSDATSIAKFGELYCEITEGSGSLVQTSAQALALATLVVRELGDPVSWFAADRPLHLFVELKDRITFFPDAKHFSTNTAVCVIGVSHAFDAAGARTVVELKGAKPAIRSGKRWQDRFTGRGRSKQAPVRTLGTPASVVFAPGVGGGLLTWAYPAGRVGRVVDAYLIHVGTTGFTPSAANLVGRTRSTAFAFNHYLDADDLDPLFAKVIAKDKYNNVSAASAQVSLGGGKYTTTIPMFVAREQGATGTTINGVTELVIGEEDLDTHGWYNTATGRYTPLVAGWYTFSASISVPSSAVRIYIYLAKNGTQNGLNSGVLDSPSSSDIVQSIERDIEMNGTTDYVSVFGDTQVSRAILLNSVFRGKLIKD